jgi:uncharacterized delta-60 repeat protein
MLTVRRTLVVLGTAFSLVVWASAAWAAGGALDTSFSGNGKLVTDFTTGFDEAAGLAIQPDGKIVAAGWAAGNGGQFALARYNANGSLDTTFSGDGKVATNFTSAFDWATDIALQADGKIVAVGASFTAGGQIAVARYKTNGGLDTTFSGDGKVLTNITTGFDGAGGVVIQPDGKIVAAGLAGGGGGQFLLVRYNPNGSLDSTFSGDGKLATNFSSGYDTANELALQANGKIVAAGFSHDADRFALARYNTNGSLDTTFSGDGRQTTQFTTGLDGAASVAVQADQKIVAVGWAGGGGGQFAVTRYHTGGSLDTTFSGDGKAVANLSANEDAALDVAIQPDGKIVAVGVVLTAGAQWGLARFKTNGGLDTTFSGDGKQTTNFTSGWDQANRVAIDTMGRIVVAGGADGGGGRFAVARYLAS